MIVIILAAGKGTRMQPLTDTRLKGSLPIHNQPLLLKIADMIHNSGIMEKLVLVISPWQEDAMKELFSQTEYFTKVAFAIQDPAQGTGDAVAQAEPFMDDNQQCLVLNGDILTDIEEVLPRLIDHHSKLDALCSIVVYPGKGERYGQLQVTADGRVLDIKEKIKSSEITDEIGYINAGIYLFERQIFQAIRDTPLSARGEYEITDAIALLGKLGVIGAVTTSPWISLEHPLDLLKAQSFLKPDEELLCMQFHSGGEIGFKAAEGIFFEKGPDFALSSITIKGPVLIGKGTLIETGSIIGPNAFIGCDCEIGPECSVSNSLIMDNCRIGAKCQIINLICAEEILIGDKCIITLNKEKSKGISTLENYALIGGKTIISANVKLPQGIKIKAHSIVKDDSEIHSD